MPAVLNAGITNRNVIIHRWCSLSARKHDVNAVLCRCVEYFHHFLFVVVNAEKAVDIKHVNRAWAWLD